MKYWGSLAKSKKTKKSSSKKKKSPKKAKGSSTPKSKKKLQPIDLITTNSFARALSLKEIVAYNQRSSYLQNVKFKKEFIKIAGEHARLGLCALDIARKLMIHRSTLNDWATRYPAFGNAILEGESEYIKTLGPKLLEHMAEPKRADGGSIAIQ